MAYVAAKPQRATVAIMAIVATEVHEPSVAVVAEIGGYAMANSGLPGSPAHRRSIGLDGCTAVDGPTASTGHNGRGPGSTAGQAGHRATGSLCGCGGHAGSDGLQSTEGSSTSGLPAANSGRMALHVQEIALYRI